MHHRRVVSRPFYGLLSFLKVVKKSIKAFLPLEIIILQVLSSLKCKCTKNAELFIH